MAPDMLYFQGFRGARFPGMKLGANRRDIREAASFSLRPLSGGRKAFFGLPDILHGAVLLAREKHQGHMLGGRPSIVEAVSSEIAKGPDLPNAIEYMPCEGLRQHRLEERLPDGLE